MPKEKSKQVKSFILQITPQNGKVLSQKEFIEYLGLSFRQFKRLMKGGVPWHGKITRKQFTIGEFKRWVEANIEFLEKAKLSFLIDGINEF